MKFKDKHFNTVFIAYSLIKLTFTIFYIAPLTLAIEENSIDAVKFLLANEKVDINFPKILFNFFSSHLKIQYFNTI